MNVLGFDTSTAASTACVLRTDAVAFEHLPRPEALSQFPAHARELMPAIYEVMNKAELSFGQLDAIGVGIGPGTFTGLRIGVATARSLALSVGLDLRPVSSLAALAAGIDGDPALPLIDAKRGEVFAALFSGGERRWAPFAGSPAEVAGRIRDEGLSPLAAGDGSVRFRGVLEGAGIRVEPDDSSAHVVRSLHVCRLAAAAEPTAPEAVLPEYLRPPDATSG